MISIAKIFKGVTCSLPVIQGEAVYFYGAVKIVLFLNCFFYCYEFKYMDRVCKENYNLAKKLSFTSRYIYDRITLNNDGLFDNSL